MYDNKFRTCSCQEPPHGDASGEMQLIMRRRGREEQYSPRSAHVRAGIGTVYMQKVYGTGTIHTSSGSQQGRQFGI